MVSFARADSDSRSCVQTGSQTTLTSTVSTPSSAFSRSGIAVDMFATNGHQPVVGTRSTSTWPPADAHVLDHPHVDDGDAAVGAAGVVHVAEGVEQLRRRPRSIALPRTRSRCESRWCAVARSGSAGSARAHRHAQAVSRYDPPRTTPPAVLVGGSPTHSQTLPASCSAPPAAAPSGWARTGTVQPQPASTLLHRSGSNVSPHGHARPSTRAPRPPILGAREPDRPAQLPSPPRRRSRPRR